MKQLSYDSTRGDLVPYSVRTLLDGQLITLEQDTDEYIRAGQPLRKLRFPVWQPVVCNYKGEQAMGTIIAQWVPHPEYMRLISYQVRMLADGAVIFVEEDTDAHCRAASGVDYEQIDQGTTLRFAPGDTMLCDHMGAHHLMTVVARQWVDPKQSTVFPYLARVLRDGALVIMPEDSAARCQPRV